MARGGALNVERVLAASAGRAPACGDVRIVAIDGPSGAGKSTLGAAVARALGCPVLPVDLLYPGWDGLAEGVRLLCAQVLVPLASGRPGRFRVWDWERDAWGAERLWEPTRWLVVEGCGSSTGCAGEFAALRVWLDAPEEVRRRRALARDGEVYAPHWERWAAQERAIFAGRAQERADLVLTADPRDEPGASSAEDGQDVGALRPRR